MSSPSHQTLSISVVDASAVGHARRVTVALAEKLGFDEVDRGELALIVTEAGTNLLQHAGGGELLVRALVAEAPGIELLALDRGPGMVDLAQCLQDGYSTGGSRGVGMGSIVRLADHFDVFTRKGGGTALLARCFVQAPPPAQPAPFGAVCIVYPGEEVVGDGWSVLEDGARTCVLMVDGLGHGLPAAAAAAAAIRHFESAPVEDPAQMLQQIHRGLSGTRGAAGAIILVDWSARTVCFSGVGNISGALVSAETSRGLSSHNGILGQGQPRFQGFEYAWPDGGQLVLHSDGVSSRWNLQSYPGLLSKDPSLAAGILYRDFFRRDDATVLVLREQASPRGDAP